MLSAGAVNPMGVYGREVKFSRRPAWSCAGQFDVSYHAVAAGSGRRGAVMRP